MSSSIPISGGRPPAQRYAGNYKTVPCKYWIQTGTCPYGEERCTFLHDVGNSFRSPQSIPRSFDEFSPFEGTSPILSLPRASKLHRYPQPPAHILAQQQQQGGFLPPSMGGGNGLPHQSMLMQQQQQQQQQQQLHHEPLLFSSLANQGPRIDEDLVLEFSAPPPPPPPAPLSSAGLGGYDPKGGLGGFRGSPYDGGVGGQYGGEPSKNPSFRTRTCKFWLQGHCPHARCTFLHAVQDAPPPPPSSVVPPSQQPPTHILATQFSGLAGLAAANSAASSWRQGGSAQEFSERNESNPNFRSKPCKYFDQGTCPKGDRCTYLHPDHPRPAYSADTTPMPSRPSSPGGSRADSTGTGGPGSTNGAGGGGGSGQRSVNAGHALYKSAPCRYDATPEGCSKGAKCSFRHVEDEGNPALLGAGYSGSDDAFGGDRSGGVAAGGEGSGSGETGGKHRLWRTEPCAYFQKGTCSRGETCNFLHVPAHEKAHLGRKPCLSWTNHGSCPFGRACRYRHDVALRGVGAVALGLGGAGDGGGGRVGGYPMAPSPLHMSSQLQHSQGQMGMQPLLTSSMGGAGPMHQGLPDVEGRTPTSRRTRRRSAGTGNRATHNGAANGTVEGGASDEEDDDDDDDTEDGRDDGDFEIVLGALGRGPMGSPPKAKRVAAQAARKNEDDEDDDEDEDDEDRGNDSDEEELIVMDGDFKKLIV